SDVCSSDLYLHCTGKGTWYDGSPARFPFQADPGDSLESSSLPPRVACQPRRHCAVEHLRAGISRQWESGTSFSYQYHFYHYGPVLWPANFYDDELPANGHVVVADGYAPADDTLQRIYVPD